MNNLPLYLGFGITCLIISAHYFTKILDWRERKFKASTPKTKFISDLYLLQIKWSKRGETEFSDAISIVINSFSREEVPEPETEYGKNLIKSLKNIDRNKILEFLRETENEQ